MDFKQSIILKLSTNNEHKGQPDTPEHHFKRVLTSLYLSNGTPDYVNTWNYATSLTANNEMDVRNLMLKYPPAMNKLEWLYGVPAFRDYGFHPRTFLEAQKTIWGVSSSLF